jgi:hypothetical protein
MRFQWTLSQTNGSYTTYESETTSAVTTISMTDLHIGTLKATLKVTNFFDQSDTSDVFQVEIKEGAVLIVEFAEVGRTVYVKRDRPNEFPVDVTYSCGSETSSN